MVQSNEKDDCAMLIQCYCDQFYLVFNSMCDVQLEFAFLIPSQGYARHPNNFQTGNFSDV